MRLRLGEYLVRSGAITTDQRDEILELQRSNGRPFGALAEELFGVRPGSIEKAWASQFAATCEWVDPASESPDASALDTLTRRQAWQFRCVPLRYEPSGELLLCTTKANLARALRFAGWRLGSDVGFVLASENDLERALGEHYPIDGLGPSGDDPESLMDWLAA